MRDTKQSNKTIRIFILVFGVGLILWSLYQERKPQKELCSLEYRMVTGLKDGNFQVILMETADRFFVLDSAFRETFEVNDAEIISRQEQVKLMAAYQDLQFRASLANDQSGLTRQVRLTREEFNRLSFSQLFEAEISKQVPDSLISINTP